MDPNNLRSRAVTRAERPQTKTPSTTPASTNFRPESKQSSANDSGRKKYLIGGAVIAVVLALTAAAWFLLLSGEKIQHDRYQAVFLDNGQVFFGDLKNLDGDYLTLENAYYTQNQTPAGDNQDEEQPTPPSNSVALVQVGDEVYGPENTMSIRADQVLFWQNLREDSKVAQAIANSQ